MIILNENEANIFHNIIRNICENEEQNLAQADQNNNLVQQDIDQNKVNEMLTVDSQIRQSNPLMKDIDTLLQAKTLVYDNIKNEMESKIKFKN